MYYEALISSNLLEKKKLTLPKRILIVEDDDSQKVIFEWLIRNVSPDIHFDWKTDVETAIEALRKKEYSLVLSDFMLGEFRTGLDIWEYCNERLPHCEFVMMSSLNIAQFCKIIGAHEISPYLLSKPINVDEIQGIIRTALNK